MVWDLACRIRSWSREVARSRAGLRYELRSHPLTRRSFIAFCRRPRLLKSDGSTLNLTISTDELPSFNVMLWRCLFVLNVSQRFFSLMSLQDWSSKWRGNAALNHPGEWPAGFNKFHSTFGKTPNNNYWEMLLYQILGQMTPIMFFALPAITCIQITHRNSVIAQSLNGCS